MRDVLIYFVGHGGFADDASYEFCFLPRLVDTSTLKTTGLRIDELAEVLQKEVRFTRRYLVLDCCFAGAAYRYFLGATDETAKGKTRAAFRRFPTHGSALLCSSNQDRVNVSKPENCTLRGQLVVVDDILEIKEEIIGAQEIASAGHRDDPPDHSAIEGRAST